MWRTVVIAALGAVLAVSAHAQPRPAQGTATQKTGGQLRAECYRELGYTPAMAQRGSQTVIQQVNECVARKQAGR